MITTSTPQGKRVSWEKTLALLVVALGALGLIGVQVYGDRLDPETAKMAGAACAYVIAQGTAQYRARLRAEEERAEFTRVAATVQAATRLITRRAAP